jgi:hypothetical protein
VRGMDVYARLLALIHRPCHRLCVWWECVAFALKRPCVSVTGEHKCSQYRILYSRGQQVVAMCPAPEAGS